MAINRRISEFPEIAGTTIDEPDLLTLVHVFEVDPVLRNKRITFSGFRDYLNKYYIQGSGNLSNGDLVISENLIVSGTTTLVGNATINATTITGVSGTFTSQVSGTTVTGETANFTDITGSTLAITTPSGATAAIVCSGVVSGGTEGFVVRGPLIILQ